MQEKGPKDSIKDGDFSDRSDDGGTDMMSSVEVPDDDCV